MDGFTEKKWFVYVGDHHEGPFSLEDIQSKMAGGAVNPDSYVWMDGMADWKMMNEVPDFGTLTGKSDSAPVLDAPVLEASNVAPTPEPLPTSLAPVEPVLQEPVISPALVEPSMSEEKTGEMDVSELRKSQSLGAEGKVKKKFSISMRWVKWAAVILICIGTGFAFKKGYFNTFLNSPAIRASIQTGSDFSRPYLIKMADLVPFLGKWISPIPTLDDVDSKEYDELKAAAQAPAALGKSGLGLSLTDPYAPTFYVVSNFPDGTQFDVYVIGIGQTLLNQISFHHQAHVTLSKKLGKTPVIQYPDGKPIPRGEFLVYLVAAPGQAGFESIQSLSIKDIPPELPKDAKILAFKTYFLGGPKDVIYSSRLKEYHEKLSQKAATELNEIKQFSATLATQLEASQTKFNLLKKGKLNPKQRKGWESFHNEWMKLQGQLDQIFLKWTPEVIQQQFFYGVLYQQTQQLGQLVEKVHGLEQAYFSGGHDPKTLDIQLGEAVSSAQTSLSLLKAKTAQAESLPPTPNGMPRRDGL